MTVVHVLFCWTAVVMSRPICDVKTPLLETHEHKPRAVKRSAAMNTRFLSSINASNGLCDKLPRRVTRRLVNTCQVIIYVSRTSRNQQADLSLKTHFDTKLYMSHAPVHTGCSLFFLDILILVVSVRFVRYISQF